MSGATIDCDGANGQNGQPFAYRMDDKGLDVLSSAGYPNTRWWKDIFVERQDGKPMTDGDRNIYSTTAYVWKDRPLETRYVDATTVPYVVVDSVTRKAAKGIVLGCRAKVSWKGRSVECVVADVGPAKHIGEISMAAAKALGIPSSPRNGGVESGVIYEIWPGEPATIQGETYELIPV